MKVRRRVGRVESVEIEEIKLLRKNGEAAGQAIVSVDDVVDTGKGIKALALDVALLFVECFEARHVVTHEAVFNTLKEEELVFLDRAADGDTRCSSADAEELAVTPARPRQRA